MRLLLVCLAAAAFGSQSFRSDVDLVTIPCAVVDGQGAPVRGLKREDFRVWDNGVPRIVEYFWQDDDQPLTLGVIIDDSESQHEQHDEHRQTAAGLLHRILRRGDRTFMISVDEDVRLWEDPMAAAGEPFGQPCPRRPANGPGLRPISVCGSTPLWNAVFDAARLKLRPLTGNKALLLLTDGFDSGSTHTWNEAVDEVHKADTAIYAIQYRSKFGGSFAPELYRLVTETGGAWFSPPGQDSDAIVSRLETDLRRRYVLGFRPEEMSFGKVRHDVRVEVSDPGMSVRFRKSYFRIPR